MKFDKNKLASWLPGKEIQLPGMTKLLTQSKSEILIIGAAVFEFYELQGWTSPLKRKTGDIDLSVALVEGNDDYRVAKSILVEEKYTTDELHPYRFHALKKIVGGFTYIDLLAHPASKNVSDRLATETMGVGPGFSFKGFGFAKKNSLALTSRVRFPNPFGFMALKMESFLSEPLKRTKDFADIAELIDGLTETGTIFDLAPLWKTLSGEAESASIKTTLGRMKNQENPREWDLENIRGEMKSRTFTDDYLDRTLVQRISDFDDLLE